MDKDELGKRLKGANRESRIDGRTLCRCESSANELNVLHSRPDCDDCADRDRLCCSIFLTYHTVMCWKEKNLSKKMHEYCLLQLMGVFKGLFQRFLSTCTEPESQKLTILKPHFVRK